MPYSNPETSRQYQRDYKRLRRAGDCQTPSQTRLPTEFRLRKAKDVLALLEGQMKEVLGDPNLGSVERARCLGYLATIALKAIDAGDLSARIESLELVLKSRKRTKPS